MVAVRVMLDRIEVGVSESEAGSVVGTILQ